MFYLSEVNMKRIIYADNAATTRIDPAVLEAMAPFTKEEYANASQPYSFSRKAKAAIKNAREEIAKCINAKPSEIFFTSGGTESDNWAIKGCAFADESKRATITSTIEHHAVLRSCQFIERLGYPVAYINPNSNGLITVEMLERVIAGTTNLVSVATANNEIGTIQPINKLAEIAHRNGAFFHTDAVQAMGHIPIDVNELNVDLNVFIKIILIVTHTEFCQLQFCYKAQKQVSAHIIAINIIDQNDKRLRSILMLYNAVDNQIEQLIHRAWTF